MDEKPSGYLSYLLRLWRATSAGTHAGTHAGEEGVPWRASLQSAESGERIGFSTLDMLFDFLRRETGAPCDGDPGADGTAE